MPIYEYKCNECGEDSEILLRSYSAEANCPHCKSADLTRLISVPGAVMTKGSHSSPDMPMCPNRERCGVPNCPGAPG
ncbi:MAG: zinc ribbon domain-containing protein [bacterium]|nr:zinc ribbon domain-containing protein [bacterium]